MCHEVWDANSSVRHASISCICWSQVVLSFSWLTVNVPERANVVFAVCIYACVFALELWKLPVTKAEHTITHFITGEVEEVDSTPSLAPLWFQVKWYLPCSFFSKGHSLILACPVSPPKFCFISSCPSLPFLQIPTHPFTPTSPSGTWWVGKHHIWRVQTRGFPGLHSICYYLCSPSAKGRGGALFSLPLYLASPPFHWSSSLPLALAHPSSLSIPVSDAVIQAAGREALQTLTLSALVERAGGLEVYRITALPLSPSPFHLLATIFP